MISEMHVKTQLVVQSKNLDDGIGVVDFHFSAMVIKTVVQDLLTYQWCIHIKHIATIINLGNTAEILGDSCRLLPRDASAEHGDATVSRLSVRP